MSQDVKKVELSGWGRYPRARCRVVRPNSASAINLVNESEVIARGAGRSYGDAAISSTGTVLMAEELIEPHSFDAASGILTAGAGTTIANILDAFVAAGWFPTVTPGTKFVTLGGCVAADVHGKNHHRDGSFGAHVSELEILLADNSIVCCSPSTNPELFSATVGGMGLTGIITRVSYKLRRIETPWMIVSHHIAQNLESAIELMEDPSVDDEYKVCWVDTTARGSSFGRGIVISGHHAAPAELPVGSSSNSPADKQRRLRVPIDFPNWVLNPLTSNFFNRFYFHRQAARREPFISNLEEFFYPLDAVQDWNRIYGRNGFVQYQCVLPAQEAAAGLRELLQVSAARRISSFLSVLKRFEGVGPGLLSFPMTGYSLSLDFPAREPVFQMFKDFDEIVVNRGGRVYLAKDACLKAETFHRMYPQLDEWRGIKARFDPDNRFISDLSKRLSIS